MIRGELKDYPLTLRHNAASYRLAKELYDCRCEAYGFRPMPWDELSQDARLFYMEAAQSVLNQIKTLPPIGKPTITLVRRDGAQV